MEKPKKEANKSANESEIADDASVENSEKKDAGGRRLQDSIISKDPSRKLNLDRRTKGSDRRIDTDPGYNGPARRYNIDRRLNTKDRRGKD